MMKEIKRGDLYYARLDPVVGSEQGGTRPVLILQNNMGNKFSPTTIIAGGHYKQNQQSAVAHSCHAERHTRSCVRIHSSLGALRTIDCKRLGSYICTLDERIMAKVDQALAVSVGLNDEQR